MINIQDIAINKKYVYNDLKLSYGGSQHVI